MCLARGFKSGAFVVVNSSYLMEVVLKSFERLLATELLRLLMDRNIDNPQTNTDANAHMMAMTRGELMSHTNSEEEEEEEENF